MLFWSAFYVCYSKSALKTWVNQLSIQNILYRFRGSLSPVSFSPKPFHHFLVWRVRGIAYHYEVQTSSMFSTDAIHRGGISEASAAVEWSVEIQTPPAGRE